MIDTELNSLYTDNEQISDIVDMCFQNGYYHRREMLRCLPLNETQILIVKSYRYISGQYWQYCGVDKTLEGDILILEGEPSPSSAKNLKRTYITFYHRHNRNLFELRPKYYKKEGSIILYMDYNSLPIIQAQLKCNKVYVQITHFKEGELWGDVHTENV